MMLQNQTHEEAHGNEPLGWTFAHPTLPLSHYDTQRRIDSLRRRCHDMDAQVRKLGKENALLTLERDTLRDLTDALREVRAPCDRALDAHERSIAIREQQIESKEYELDQRGSMAVATIAVTALIGMVFGFVLGRLAW